MSNHNMHHPKKILDSCIRLFNSPGWHTGTYFMGAMEAQSGIWKKVNPDNPFFIERLHLSIAPWAYLITQHCRTMWPEHTELSTTGNTIKNALLGSSIAGLTLGSHVAIEGYLGWIQRKEWGWNTFSLEQITKYVIFFIIANTALAYNEEMLFRGHGLTIVSRTFTPWIANMILIPFFTIAHMPFKYPVVAVSAYSFFAFNHAMMRYLSNGLVMPIAYHATWNWLQDGVFCAHQDTPSLIPITVNGPELWTGKLGESSPGILMVIIQGILAIVLGWLGWRKYKSIR